nr:CoA-transferase [Zoogloea sp.]
MSVRKIYSTAALALADVLHDDMTIMSGGFGLCGIPSVLIDAVLASGVRGLTIISNNPGAEGLGLGKLFNTRQVQAHLFLCRRERPVCPPVHGR